jgi:hypothetical protein
MEYAIQLLLPILGGLLLGNWLHQTFGLSYLWMLGLAILGMAGGIGVLYKQQMTGKQALPKIQFAPRPPSSAKDKGHAHQGHMTGNSSASQGMTHEELLEFYKKADREPPSDDFALNELLGDDENLNDPSGN